MSSIKDFELAQRIHIATHQLKSRIAELEAEVARAYDALAVEGVPKERARSVANGIGVMMQRVNKSDSSYQAEVARLAALNQQHSISMAGENAARIKAEAELSAATKVIAELVACKDLKEQSDYNLLYAQTTGSLEKGKELEAEYRLRKPAAWQAARAWLEKP